MAAGIGGGPEPTFLSLSYAASSALISVISSTEQSMQGLSSIVTNDDERREMEVWPGRLVQQGAMPLTGLPSLTAE